MAIMGSSRAKLAIHGVFLSVGGTGVVIIGAAGIGKSECALELVTRGHRLIADDVIEILTINDILIGSAPERFAGLLEIRDLGIIDVKQLFGVDAFESEHRIDICVELSAKEDRKYRDRIGGGIGFHEIFDVKIPKFEVFVDGKRNIPLLVETAEKLWSSREESAEEGLAASHDALVSSMSNNS